MTPTRRHARPPARLACTAALIFGMVLGAGAPAPAEPPAPGPAAPAGTGLVEMTASRPSGVVSAWLDNGIRVHHRRMPGPDRETAPPNGPGEPRVLVTIALAGGELHETGATRGLSEAAAIAWRTPATRGMDAAAMAAHLREGRIGVTGYAGDEAMVLRIDSPAANLDKALGAAAALLTEPVVDENALAAWAEHRAKKAASAPTDPRWIMSDALRGALLPADVARSRPLTAERAREIDAPSAQAWLDRILRSPAAPMEVAIVGDIPVADALRAAEAALGTLPARERISSDTYAPLRRVQGSPGPVAIRTERPIEGGRAIAGAGFLGTDGIDMRTHRALSLATHVLDERVTVRIRERGWGGISDIITSTLPGGFTPGQPGVVVSAVLVAPEHAVAAADLVESIVKDLAASGPTPDELRRARHALTRDVRRTLASPYYWSAVLAHATYRDSTPDDLAAAAETLEALTAEDVTDALRRCATPGRSIHLIVRPAKNP